MKQSSEILYFNISRHFSMLLFSKFEYRTLTTKTGMTSYTSLVKSSIPHLHVISGACEMICHFIPVQVNTWLTTAKCYVPRRTDSPKIKVENRIEWRRARIQWTKKLADEVIVFVQMTKYLTPYRSIRVVEYTGTLGRGWRNPGRSVFSSIQSMMSRSLQPATLGGGRKYGKFATILVQRIF